MGGGGGDGGLGGDVELEVGEGGFWAEGLDGGEGGGAFGGGAAA